MHSCSFNQLDATKETLSLMDLPPVPAVVLYNVGKYSIFRHGRYIHDLAKLGLCPPKMSSIGQGNLGNGQLL